MLFLRVDVALQYTPWKINGWNLRIHPWKRKFIFQASIFRFYVNLLYVSLHGGFKKYQVNSYCWWFRNPARKPVEVGRLSHCLQSFTRFLAPSKRWLVVWDFWTINRMSMLGLISRSRQLTPRGACQLRNRTGPKVQLIAKPSGLHVPPWHLTLGASNLLVLDGGSRVGE